MDIKAILRQNRDFFNSFNRGLLLTELDGRIFWKNKEFDNYMEIAYMISENISKLKEGLGTFEYEGGRFEINKVPILFSDEKYLLFILDVSEIVDARSGHDSYMRSSGGKYTFDNLIGRSEVMQKLVEDAKKVAMTDSNIIIHGETGSGKEIIAQSIHYESSRRKGKFIAVNCSAVPENLMESIFFGSVKGVFSGAENKKGLFEIASGGTIFLDEINSMPMNLQAKLLRVIQEGTVRRIGGTEEVKIDSRIISAMNMNPFDEVDKGKVRNDLLYRLGVVFIKVPPLRERIDDIGPLAEYFIKMKSRKLGIGVKPVNKIVYQLFMNNDWEGNVRQLEHVIESAVVMARYSSEINAEHLPAYFLKTTTASKGSKNEIELVQDSLKHELETIEKNRIIFDLENSGGNMTAAAKTLGISRQNLYKKMKKYDIKVSEQNK
ncbi:arginine utilization regulatory protein [Dethiosulfatibacter aminovorans DSM 17477]|uniref:Arginine utilization regulatory protein n=1 Tax=Dethiosulfatibacter aminovorans DSM 17477 TaxID=1121476 RepID=A0A1M6MVH7_9FIRM|nr:sigma 54-interacting transcriptional regulator [Dethiosulfatibacter aminovorans]SHJ87457.1 arginine utilization regulatory protein [Dethiosulfatibacter aminovorans DSM 17477]